MRKFNVNKVSENTYIADIPASLLKEMGIKIEHIKNPSPLATSLIYNIGEIIAQELVTNLERMGDSNADKAIDITGYVTADERIIIEFEFYDSEDEYEEDYNNDPYTDIPVYEYNFLADNDIVFVFRDMHQSIDFYRKNIVPTNRQGALIKYKNNYGIMVSSPHFSSKEEAEEEAVRIGILCGRCRELNGKVYNISHSYITEHGLIITDDAGLKAL